MKVDCGSCSEQPTTITQDFIDDNNDDDDMDLMLDEEELIRREMELREKRMREIRMKHEQSILKNSPIPQTIQPFEET